MSQTESHAGDAPNQEDSQQPQGGNRPANNAVRSTPGSLPTKSFQGDSEASDFLGLDDELEGAAAGGSQAFELLSDTSFGKPSLELATQAESLDLSPATGDVLAQDLEEHVTDDGAFALDGQLDDFPFGPDNEVGEYEPETYAAADEELDDDAESEFDDAADFDEDEPAGQQAWSGREAEAGLHGAWNEPEPSSAGTGRLVGLAVGAVFLGLIGFAGFKFLGSAAQDERGEPLAANPRPVSEAGFDLPVALLAEPSEDPEIQPSAGEVEAQAEVDGEAVTAELDLGGDAAREAFDDLRGNEPPVWFDPDLDGGSEPVETGWTPEAEAVTQAEAQDDVGGDAAAAGDLADAGGAPGADAPLELVQGELQVEPSADVLELVQADPVAEDAGTDVPPVAAAAEDLLAQATPPADPDAEGDRAPVVPSTSDPLVPAGAVSGSPVELLPATQVAAAGGGTLGPLPALGQTPASASGAGGKTQDQSRQTRTSTLAVEDVLLAPTMDASSLRQASARDLSGVWKETSVPMQGIDSKSRVLTPNVGRVRVILKSKDIFEGTLYAVGNGNVWLDSELGRIAVTGARIASVQKLDSKEGAPVLGSTGSQDLAGLTRVRVKTPGGTFFGKVISRDEERTTVITDDGARLTLESKNVEFLADAPQITVRGKVAEKTKVKGEAQSGKP